MQVTSYQQWHASVRPKELELRQADPDDGEDWYVLRAVEQNGSSVRVLLDEVHAENLLEDLRRALGSRKGGDDGEPR